MTPREVRLDQLLGRKVVDAAGEVIGRLEEAVAEVRVEAGRSDHVVREFHVGKFAMLERLGAGLLGRELVRLLGVPYAGYVVPWEAMDLGEPERPRVKVKKAELKRQAF
jgi:sporulation protein YlmC with PRC-barrel domain